MRGMNDPVSMKDFSGEYFATIASLCGRGKNQRILVGYVITEDSWQNKIVVISHGVEIYSGQNLATATRMYNQELAK